MTDQITIKPSVCPLDCPDTCSLSVDVKDGVIAKVRGARTNPYTAGVICNKVARSYPGFVHGPTRLRHPMRRGPDGFEQISWDEALDLIHSAFSAAIETHGSQSILPLNYSGPHGELAGGSMDRRFFYQLGALDLDRGPLCGGVRGAAYSSLCGAVPGMPPAQAKSSDLIMVWGNNVSISNLHFMRVLKEARRTGAKVVVIDPKRIKVAQQSDLYLQIKPGTDVVLALALAAALKARGALDQDFIDQWVLGAEVYLDHAAQYTRRDVAEICNISETEFETLVDWIANAKTIATSIGVGMERSASGGASLRAAMALNALMGQHGRVGAGIIAKSGGHVPKTPAKLQAAHLRDPKTRVLNILDVPAALLDRGQATPISAVMIYNHNPVATHPDQQNMIKALSQPDVFVVGCDVVMTDSMALCDVILPAASHFEHDDIFGSYGHNYLQRAEPVIAPVGESLPNTEIFRRLAARFGFAQPEFQASDHELMRDAVSDLESLVDPDAPQEFGGDAGADNILCKDFTPLTPSGKIELISAELETKFDAALPQYRQIKSDFPLQLISPSSDKRINATFGGEGPSAGMEVMEMHPVDAAQRGLETGQTVKVWNALSEVILSVQVSELVQPGVVYVPKGAWRHTGGTGATINALISSDSRCDLIDGAAYNDTFVDVRGL